MPEMDETPAPVTRAPVTRHNSFSMIILPLMLICVLFLSLGVSVGRYIVPHQDDATLQVKYRDGYYDGYLDGKAAAALEPQPYFDFSVWPASLDIHLGNVYSTIVDKITITNKAVTPHEFLITVVEPDKPLTHAGYSQEFKPGKAEWLWVDPAPILIIGEDHQDAGFTLTSKDIPEGSWELMLNVAPAGPPTVPFIQYRVKILIIVNRDGLP